VAARVTPAGNQVANTPASASYGNGVAGGWLLDLRKTAAQTGITSETTLTGLSGACTVNANRRVKVSFAGSVQISATDTAGIYRIKRDGTTINDYPVPSPATAGGPSQMGVSFFVPDTPTAGSHTYSVTLARTTGTGTLAEFSNPGILLVEDIGPAS
jgi:hypothetical protein